MAPLLMAVGVASQDREEEEEGLKINDEKNDTRRRRFQNHLPRNTGVAGLRSRDA
jgi:hypothetical protein